MSWHLNTSSIVKKSQHQLFFYTQYVYNPNINLGEFTMNKQIWINFYHCTIESLLTSSMTACLEMFCKEKKRRRRSFVLSCMLCSQNIGLALHTVLLMTRLDILRVNFLTFFLQGNDIALLSALLRAIHKVSFPVLSFFHSFYWNCFILSLSKCYLLELTCFYSDVFCLLNVFFATCSKYYYWSLRGPSCLVPLVISWFA